MRFYWSFFIIEQMFLLRDALIKVLIPIVVCWNFCIWMNGYVFLKNKKKSIDIWKWCAIINDVAVEEWQKTEKEIKKSKKVLDKYFKIWYPKQAVAEEQNKSSGRNFLKGAALCTKCELCWLWRPVRTAERAWRCFGSRKDRAETGRISQFRKLSKNFWKKVKKVLDKAKQKW